MNDEDEYIYDEHGDKIKKEEPVINKFSGDTKEKGIEKYKSRGTVLFPFITGNSIMVLFAVSLVSLFILLLYNPRFTYIALFSACLTATSLLFGYIIVNEKEFIVLQRLGVFWKILDPGIHLTIPLADEIIYKDPVTKTRLTEKVEKLPMFEEINKDPVRTIDFKDSAEKGVTFGAYYYIKDPAKAAYYAKNLEKFIKDTIETAAKAVFGNTTVDDANENKLKITDSTLVNLNETIIGVNNVTAAKSLENAGIGIASIYFEDIDFSEVTKKKRETLFNTRQDKKIANEQEEVETINVRIKEQKKLQQQKEDEGVRIGLEAIAGVDEKDPEKRMSIKEVAQFKVNMAKYGKGVERISEINVGGGDPADIKSTVAGLAAIAGTTVEETKNKNKTEKAESDDAEKNKIKKPKEDDVKKKEVEK